jgi:hypothetical protein
MLLDFSAFLFLQLAPQDFSRGGSRQALDELHDARHLERRHSMISAGFTGAPARGTISAFTVSPR